MKTKPIKQKDDKTTLEWFGWTTRDDDVHKHWVAAVVLNLFTMVGKACSSRCVMWATPKLWAACLYPFKKMFYICYPTAMEYKSIFCNTSKHCR